MPQQLIFGLAAAHQAQVWELKVGLETRLTPETVRFLMVEFWSIDVPEAQPPAASG